MKKNLLTKYTTLLNEAKLITMLVGPIALLLSLSSSALPLYPTYNAAAMAPGTATGRVPQNAIPQISDKEMQGLYDYLKNMDEKELEEIEKLGKQMLTEMGFDPVTLQPIQKGAPQTAQRSYPDYPMAVPPMQSSLPKIEPIAQQIQKAPATLSSLINHLTSLRTKAASLPLAAHAIKPWLADINELIYFLKVINTPELHKHLALAEWSSLLTMLAALDAALSAYEPLMIHIDKPAPWKDPYEILGIFSFAPQKEIDAAYKRHKDRLDPDHIRARLTAAHVSHQEQEKAVKEAQLSYDLITDAYEQLKDEKARALVDKERKAIAAVQEAATNSIKEASSAITQALSNAIYKDQILNHIEQFLKKYEPYQLEARKKMETLEELQRKELRAYEQLKPQGKTIAVGHYDMPPVPSYDRPYYDRPWYPQGGAPFREPSFGGYDGYPQARGFGLGGGQRGGPQRTSQPSQGIASLGAQSKGALPTTSPLSGNLTGLPSVPGMVPGPGTKKTAHFNAIALLSNQLDAFNQDFGDGLSAAKLAPETKLKEYLEYQDSKLTGIEQNLKTIAYESEHAKDARKKSQNQEYWKGLEKSRKEFTENIKKLQPLYTRLETIKAQKALAEDLSKTKGGQEEPAEEKVVDQTTEKPKTTVVDSILDYMKKIGSKLKKTDTVQPKRLL